MQSKGKKAIKSWPHQVKALITKHGSPEALAVACGVSYLTVQRWAKGTHKPSPLAQHALTMLGVEETKT